MNNKQIGKLEQGGNDSRDQAFFVFNFQILDMQFVILPPVTSPGINIEEKKINNSEFDRCYCIKLKIFAIANEKKNSMTLNIF